MLKEKKPDELSLRLLTLRTAAGKTDLRKEYRNDTIYLKYCIMHWTVCNEDYYQYHYKAKNNSNNRGLIRAKCGYDR